MADFETPEDTRRTYDMSLSDHGFESKELKGLTYPLGGHFPKYGELYQLAPDMRWTRLPVMGNLNHINVWLLDDEEGDEPGFALADTGLFMPDTIGYWKGMFEGPLAGERISRVFVTHFHPDHVGCAGWLANRFKAKVWMNRTEWLYARLLVADGREEPPKEVIALRKFAGYDEKRLADFAKSQWNYFALAVSQLPSNHVRLEDGQIVKIGKRSWQVLTGGGHTPEHCCLVDHHNGVVIAGDQILPRITSNVSLMDSEPDADPLGEWLASISKFQKALAPDMLVLPAHGEPFTGLQFRLAKLAEGHLERLDRLEAALQLGELRGVDCFELLFDRPVGEEVFGLAAGEAMAHLRHLERTGRAHGETRDGVGWFSKV